MEPVLWLDRCTFLLLHDESLAIFGGLRGIRDEGLLDSALTRPEQIHHYRPEATLAELGAAYAYAITRNHPFFDGNKRAAFLAMTLFCRLNRQEFEIPRPEAIAAIMTLAAGEITEEQLAAWIGQHLVRLEPQP